MGHLGQGVHAASVRPEPPSSRTVAPASSIARRNSPATERAFFCSCHPW